MVGHVEALLAVVRPDYYIFGRDVMVVMGKVRGGRGVVCASDRHMQTSVKNVIFYVETLKVSKRSWEPQSAKDLRGNNCHLTEAAEHKAVA